jgi:predicted AlkP superfamily pyrophosphatase or phosphodiesterase
MLLPFFWSTIAKEGQLYGNRILGNHVDVSNPYRFSYPGYNEIFTGYPDTAVNSNDKILNQNENVLEFLNKQKGYQGRVAAFSSWDVFPYILNENRSGIYVNSGIEQINEKGAEFDLLNGLQNTTYQMLGDNVRPDLLTFFSAKEYLMKKQPRILYIAFDETDDFAHGGKYNLYLMAAHMEDKMIGDLWNYMQQQPAYAGKTTFIITTDHGRGDKIKDQWKDHGQKIEDASQIWIAVIGPDTPPQGEMNSTQQLYQRQIATTISTLLGFQFHPAHPTQEAISTISRR